jgi:hypothetical protein
MSFGRGVEPNKNVVEWARLLGKPAYLSVVGEMGEETIVDAIEEAPGRRRSRLGPAWSSNCSRSTMTKVLGKRGRR